MFGMTTMKGICVTDATLTMPYLFSTTTFMASTWVFLALRAGLATVVWDISVQTTTRDVEQEQFQQALDHILRDFTSKDEPGLNIGAAIERAKWRTWTPERVNQCS